MTALLNGSVGQRLIAKGLLLVAFFSLNCGPSPSLATDRKAGQSSLPADVRAFVERRDACDHFRGEDSPDPDRRAQIDDELHRLCSGTDTELARLKRAHAGHRAVQRALDQYETKIEVP